MMTLKELRKGLSLTANDLAAKVGCCRSSLYQMEDGMFIELQKTYRRVLLAEYKKQAKNEYKKYMRQKEITKKAIQQLER